MTRQTTAKGMTLLAATFGREADDLMLEAYHAALNDLSDREFMTAVEILLRTSRYFPVPADFRDIARPPQVKNPETILQEIQRAFLKYGRVRTPQWSTPEIADAVEAVGGWQYLCNQHEADYQKYTVPQLVRAYQATAGRELVNVNK